MWKQKEFNASVNLALVIWQVNLSFWSQNSPKIWPFFSLLFQTELLLREDLAYVYFGWVFDCWVWCCNGLVSGDALNCALFQRLSNLIGECSKLVLFWATLKILLRAIRVFGIYSSLYYLLIFASINPSIKSLWLCF